MSGPHGIPCLVRWTSPFSPVRTASPPLSAQGIGGRDETDRCIMQPIKVFSSTSELVSSLAVDASDSRRVASPATVPLSSLLTSSSSLSPWTTRRPRAPSLSLAFCCPLSARRTEAANVAEVGVRDGERGICGMPAGGCNDRRFVRTCSCCSCWCVGKMAVVMLRCICYLIDRRVCGGL
jgi:hypothetical protein